MAKHEYKAGDLVRLVKTDQVDRVAGLQIGDVFELEDIENGLACCKSIKTGLTSRFCSYQIEPADIEPSTPHPTEREQRIRQMAHEYLLAFYSGNGEEISLSNIIEAATELYDTPIPPPSKP